MEREEEEEGDEEQGYGCNQNVFQTYRKLSEDRFNLKSKRE